MFTFVGALRDHLCDSTAFSFLDMRCRQSGPCGCEISQCESVMFQILHFVLVSVTENIAFASAVCIGACNGGSVTIAD